MINNCYCVLYYNKKATGNYPRTRASDSKHLTALIHSIFLVNMLGLCLIFGLSTKKLGFAMILYEKNFEM